MNVRWTRTTVTTAVAALTLVVVFAATLLFRSGPPATTAVAAPDPRPDSPSAATTSTPGDTDGGDTGAGDTAGDNDSRTVAVSSGSGHAHASGTGTAARPGTGDRQDAAAVAAATTFLSDVAGMTPVAGPVERNGDRATVTFYGRGEDGHVVKGIHTAVTLRRSGGAWVPTGARTPTIAVDTPTSGATIASPLTVTGRAHAYEGTVLVRVVEDRPGKYTEVGEGFVTGAGDHMGPFSGAIEFVEHNSERGWVVFTEESAADGSTMRATVVRVAFADDVKPGKQPGEEPVEGPPAPTLDDLWWSPELPVEDGWLKLPAGPGELMLNVTAEHADRVELVITPTGTETAPLAEVLPMNGSDDGPYAVAWEYGDGPILAHVGLRAIGPGGETNVDVFGVVKE